MRYARHMTPPRWPAFVLGYTILELLFVVATTLVLTAIAVPLWSGATDHARAMAAARYVAGALARLRVEAVKRSTTAAARFTQDGARYTVGYYMDGDGNGVRAADIARGIDERIGPDDRLADQFAGVEFGIHADVLDPDSSLPLSGDPIRLGRSDILSFTALGSSTSGTVYVAGRGRQQFAVRVLGATGRTRVLYYRFDTRAWVEP